MATEPCLHISILEQMCNCQMQNITATDLCSLILLVELMCYGVAGYSLSDHAFSMVGWVIRESID